MSEFQNIVDESVKAYLAGGNVGTLNDDIDHWCDDAREYKIDIVCMVVNSLYVKSGYDLDAVRDMDFQLSPEESGDLWLYVTRLEAKHQADIHAMKRGQGTGTINTSSGTVRNTGDSESSDDADLTDGEDILVSDMDDSDSE